MQVARGGDMPNFEELSRKSGEFRNAYYGKETPPSIGHEMCPEAMELINATLFGHIYQRPAVDIKTRSLCTIAALTVLNRDKQLPGHITGALNSGVTKQQIVEIIVQLLFYGGYPCTVNALAAARETFAVWDKEHGKR
jgi:4-carboxymuconolactone decarboxylase